MSGIVHCIENALRGMTWRPYGLRSIETHPWRPVYLDWRVRFPNVPIWDTEKAGCEDTILPSVECEGTGRRRTDTGKSSAERGTECGVRVRASESVRNDGAVACFRTLDKGSRPII